MGRGKRVMLRHDDIVKVLVGRLRDKGNLESLETHVFYDTGRYRGEVDALGYAAGRWRFYEIKTTHNDRTYDHACEQYWRFRKAHPDLKVTGIYVSSTYVQRMPERRPPHVNAQHKR